jgi:hypothetical protein
MLHKGTLFWSCSHGNRLEVNRQVPVPLNYWMHGDFFLAWFEATYPSAVAIIDVKRQQLGSGETPSRSSNWKKDEDEDLDRITPTNRSTMSDFMQANINNLRLDHARTSQRCRTAR